MKLKIFSIPARGDERLESALNEFLAKHAIVQIDRQLIQSGISSFWTICVGYDEVRTSTAGSKRQKVDYREVLNEEQFRDYSALREWRKAVADAENQPLYAVFSNAELAAICQLPLQTVAEIGAIEGVGKAKLERYGEAVCELIQQRRKELAAPAVGAGNA